MELPRHLEDRTGPATMNVVLRWTIVQRSMGTLPTQRPASTTIYWEEEDLCQVLKFLTETSVTSFATLSTQTRPRDGPGWWSMSLPTREAEFL